MAQTSSLADEEQDWTVVSNGVAVASASSAAEKKRLKKKKSKKKKQAAELAAAAAATAAAAAVEPTRAPIPAPDYSDLPVHPVWETPLRVDFGSASIPNRSSARAPASARVAKPASLRTTSAHSAAPSEESVGPAGLEAMQDLVFQAAPHPAVNVWGVRPVPQPVPLDEIRQQQLREAPQDDQVDDDKQAEEPGPQLLLA